MDGIYEIIAELKLKDEKAKLLVELDTIRTVEKEILTIRKHYANIWHGVKDPAVKREIHKEINHLDMLKYQHIDEPKRKILDRLNVIYAVLNDERPCYGGYCKDLDYDKIMKFGIKGSRV